MSETKHEIAALLLACGAAGAWLTGRFLLIPYHICDVARWQRSTSGGVVAVLASISFKTARKRNRRAFATSEFICFRDVAV